MSCHSIAFRKDHNLKSNKYSLCYSITYSVIFCKGGNGVIYARNVDKSMIGNTFLKKIR